jgi:DNA repair protein RadD
MSALMKKEQEIYRYYQREAIDAFWAKIGSGGNKLISMATGTGKSRVIAGICKEAIEAYPETNIIIGVSSEELVEQNFIEMIGVWPGAPVGMYSAGLGVKDLTKKVTSAAIQSLWKMAYKIPRKIDLLIVDECQDIAETDGTMYRKFIADLKVCNPDLKVIGLSATVFRMSQGMLTDGKNALFDEVIYEYGMLQGITDGYLSPLVSKAMEQQFDLTGVSINKGDYAIGQLERAVDKAEINKAVVDELVNYGQDRKCWLVFCTGIDHATHIRDEVRSRGYSCEMVSGKTPKQERKDIFRRYKSGEIRCIANVNVMKKGTNVPQIDLISFLRPTKSAGFVVQAAGRGTRLSPGKSDCLLLDHAGILSEHGPIDLIRAKRKGEKGEGTAPVKTCPECKTIVFAGCTVCPECDFEFPQAPAKINAEASNAAALSTQLRIEAYPVTSVSYYRHKKEGKRDTMRVEYQCGLMHNFREWVCIEHSGGARERAAWWWFVRTGNKNVPNTIADALARTKELKVPKEVNIKKVGKYFEVVSATL